jgi:hypothetical protein
MMMRKRRKRRWRVMALKMVKQLYSYAFKKHVDQTSGQRILKSRESLLGNHTFAVSKR